MFSNPKRIPGDLGFDPLGLGVGKSAEDMERMQLRELKNGRLAMLAIGGMIHHNWIFGEVRGERRERGAKRRLGEGVEQSNSMMPIKNPQLVASLLAITAYPHN